MNFHFLIKSIIFPITLNLLLGSCLCREWDVDVSSTLEKNKAYLVKESSWIRDTHWSSYLTLSALPLQNVKQQYPNRKIYFLPKGTQIHIKKLVAEARVTYAGPIPSCSTRYGLRAYIKVPNIEYDICIPLGPTKIDSFSYGCPWTAKKNIINSWYLLDEDTGKKAQFYIPDWAWDNKSLRAEPEF